MEEFFSSFLRRAGMPASAGLSCTIYCHQFRHNYQPVGSSLVISTLCQKCWNVNNLTINRLTSLTLWRPLLPYGYSY